MELAARSCTPRGKTWLVLLLLLAVPLLVLWGVRDQSSGAAVQLMGDESSPHDEAQPGLPVPHLELGFVAESQSLESFPR